MSTEIHRFLSAISSHIYHPGGYVSDTYTAKRISRKLKRVFVEGNFFDKRCKGLEGWLQGRDD